MSKRERPGRGGSAIAAQSTPPGYRDRLRVEGATLAACGALGSVVLLVATAQAVRGPWSTIGQLAVVAILLAVLGPWATRRAMHAAQPIGPDAAAAGTGEPTPLWQLPVIVAVLSIPFGLLVGWDAALRVTGGCVLVGLTQALLLERLVAARERREGVRFVRMPGSRILVGTKLGRLSTRA